VTAVRRGRRPATGSGAGDTRERILDCARAAFAERGFDGATLRDIAARAEVDPALVHHYFSSKQRLFVAAVQFPVDVAVVIPALAAGDRSRIGERFVGAVVALWDQPATRQAIVGVVRSAASDPTAAEMMRDVLARGPLLALASAVDAPDADRRAALVGSQLMGLVMARYIAKLEPIASMTAEELAAAVGPTLTRYLTGDLGQAAAARARGVG
jgi:AcrR family transcriptional regulator